jgi:hypothetical protein
VFITVDRNLSIEQNIGKLKIGVVLLVAKGNRHSDLQPLVPHLLAALPTVRPGQVTKVSQT